MANTFFVDYEGGNDSNNGLSYANRKKRIQGISAAELNPGDEIRIMESKGAALMNVVATWTFRSQNVVMNTAVTTLLDDGDTAWTANTNITTSRNSSVYRYSANAASIAFGAPFTFGLAAYIALGATQNCATYQGLTFWFRTDTVIAANTLSLRLCSDSAGVTTVDTFPIPGINATGCWVPLYINKGSALGSSINSVALYAEVDPGTPTILLDNINTVGQYGTNNNLNLTSLISRENSSANNEGWWPIRGINGTSIMLDMCPMMTPSYFHKGYPGNTATNVAIYKTDTTQTIGDLKQNNFSSSVQTLQDSGNATFSITMTGGWNQTDMTTQTGQTWFDGMTGYGTGIHNNSQNYYYIDRIHIARVSTGIYCYGSTVNYGNVFATGCQGPGFYTYAGGRVNANVIMVTSSCPEAFSGAQIQIWQNNATPPRGEIGKLIAYCSGSTGATFTYGVAFTDSTTYNLNINSIIANFHYDGLRFVQTLKWVRIRSMKVDWCTDYAIRFEPPAGAPIEACQFDYIEGNYNTSTHLTFGYTSVARTVIIGDIYLNHGVGFTYGLELKGPTGSTAIINSYKSTNNFTSINGYDVTGKWTILKSSLDSGIVMTLANSVSGELIFRNYNGTAGDHRTYVSTVGTVFSNTSIRHTASGSSWRFSPLSTTYIDQYVPIRKKIGAVAVTANLQVTMGLWVYRDNTGLVSQLVVPGGQIGGVSANVTATAAGTINTWEQLTLTFTPTESGVVEAYFQCHGGTTYSVNIDDFSVSQGS